MVLIQAEVCRSRAQENQGFKFILACAVSSRLALLHGTPPVFGKEILRGYRIRERYRHKEQRIGAQRQLGHFSVTPTTRYGPQVTVRKSVDSPGLQKLSFGLSASSIYLQSAGLSPS